MSTSTAEIVTAPAPDQTGTGAGVVRAAGGLMPPLIVIGMHRSGTSMVTRMLEDLGLFVGREKDANWEPPLFRRLNDWLLFQSSAAWDRPESIADLIGAAEPRASASAYLARVLRGPRAVSYLGVRGLVPRASGVAMATPWGWKEPRTTVTLPLWLDVFPEARVLNVVRHGVDVAQSLRTRARKSVGIRAQRAERHRLLSTIRLRRGGFCESLRSLDLAGGFSLWAHYYNAGRTHVDALGERAMEVQYEELLADPAPHLRRLAGFAGLSVDEGAIERVAGTAKVSRAYAYRSDPELAAFAQSVAPQLAHAGYEA